MIIKNVLNNDIYKNVNNINKKTSFKSNDLTNNAYIKKNYVDLKTQELENISAVSFIMFILLGGANINFKNKLSIGKIITLGLGFVSLSTLILKIVKSIKLGKEYDSMQRSKNDTKN